MYNTDSTQEIAGHYKRRRRRWRRRHSPTEPARTNIIMKTAVRQKEGGEREEVAMTPKKSHKGTVICALEVK